MCLLSWVFGYPCPGCGFLRSLWSALRGDWSIAFQYYPIWPLLVAGVFFIKKEKVMVALLLFIFIQWGIRLFGPPEWLAMLR